MRNLQRPRRGDPVVAKVRVLSFSFWPVQKTSPRFSVQSCIYSANPWPMLRRSIDEYLGTVTHYS